MKCPSLRQCNCRHIHSHLSKGAVMIGFHFGVNMWWRSIVQRFRRLVNSTICWSKCREKPTRFNLPAKPENPKGKLKNHVPHQETSFQRRGTNGRETTRECNPPGSCWHSKDQIDWAWIKPGHRPRGWVYHVSVCDRWKIGSILANTEGEKGFFLKPVEEFVQMCSQEVLGLVVGVNTHRTCSMKISWSNCNDLTMKPSQQGYRGKQTTRLCLKTRNAP